MCEVRRTEDWEKVESKEGGFTVEMPGKPTINKSRVHTGVGGEVKTVIVGCDEYGRPLHRVQDPAPHVNCEGNHEDAELDAEPRWHGQGGGTAR